MSSAKSRTKEAEDTIAKLNGSLHSAYLAATKYWEKIKEIADQLIPKNKYEESIGALDVKFVYENKFELLNGLFADIARMRDQLGVVSEILSSKELARGAVYSRSQTYANELFTVTATFEDARGKFDEIPLDPLVLAFDGDVSLDELEGQPLNQFIISLLKRHTRDASLPDALRATIEARKDELLGVNRISGFLARNGLVPAYYGEPTGNYVVIPGDTTYDLRPLTDPDFIASHDLVLKQGAGLNKKTIEKYTTILPAKPTKLTKVEVKGDDEFHVWMRIGSSYRALVRPRFEGRSSIPTQVEGRSSIPTQDVFSRSEIESLFTVTTRPPQYYSLAHSNPVDPMYQFYADKYAVAKMDISDDMIRKRLYEEFVSRHRKLTNGKARNPEEQFRKIASDRELISEVIVQILNATVVKSDNPDVVCGYIVRYESLIREFTNLIDKEVKSVNVSADVIGHLGDVYRKVIESMSWTGFEPSFKELLMQNTPTDN